MMDREMEGKGGDSGMMNGKDMMAMDHNKMLKNQVQIEEQDLELPTDDFKSLGEEEEGAEVVLVVKGNLKDMDEDKITVSISAAALVHGKMPKLGSGMRFKNLEMTLSKQGVKDPAALAASIGRKKYGSEKMSKMAHGGM